MSKVLGVIVGVMLVGLIATGYLLIDARGQLDALDEAVVALKRKSAGFEQRERTRNSEVFPDLWHELGRLGELVHCAPEISERLVFLEQALREGAYTRFYRYSSDCRDFLDVASE